MTPREFIDGVASALAVAMVIVATMVLFVLTFAWPGLAIASRVGVLAGVALLVSVGLWAFQRFTTDARYLLPVIASLPLVGLAHGLWTRIPAHATGGTVDAVTGAILALPLALLAHGAWRRRRDRRRAGTDAAH
jgi:hypothetical protein